MPAHLDENFMLAECENMKVGDRCELLDESKSKPRGEIAYIGKVPNLNNGYFVGV